MRFRFRSSGNKMQSWSSRQVLSTITTLVSAFSLVVLFSVDPCVRLIPIILAAAPLGWGRLVALIAIYEVATLGTMVAIVLVGRSGAFRGLQAPWLDRYGDALAGGLIVATGVAVAALGW